MFKRSSFWLSVLLFVFIIKGVFLSVLFPFFQGPDEQIHYATIQHLAEPTEKTWTMRQREEKHINSDIATFNFSEETIRSAQLSQFDEVKFQSENTQAFSQSAIGFNENEIAQNKWKRYLDTYPANTSGTTSVYYLLGTQIEQALADQSILTRFFSVRLFSVILGAFVVLLTYLTARKVGLSPQNSLIAAALVAFQPMLSTSAAQVNIDIALILSFSIFIYAAISLLAKRLDWKYIALLIFSVVLGLFSKGPGIVLAVVAVPLFIFLAYQHFHIGKRRFFWSIFLLLSLFVVLTIIAVPKSYIASITNMNASSRFDSPLVSLGKYVDKTIGNRGFSVTHASYWGNFGWLDTRVSSGALNTIRNIEFIAFLGIIFFLLSKNPAPYLPQKRYVIFFLGIIVALQLAIRFYDWRVFDATAQVLIGTPGRYFLPNIIPHILLIVTGLGYFTRNKKQFDVILKTLLILSALFSLYAIINVIIPRYYL